jgi:hypothetical protein
MTFWTFEMATFAAASATAATGKIAFATGSGIPTARLIALNGLKEKLITVLALWDRSHT